MSSHSRGPADDEPAALTAAERALERFANALMWVGGIALTLMMLHISADVLGKYLFNRPIIATLEIVTWYYMVATVFLPVVYIQIHKKHLMVELFTLRWPPRRMAKLEGIVGIVGAIYVGTLAWLTGEHAAVQTAAGEIQDATFFDLPVWPSRWLLPVAMTAMALVFATQAWRDLRFGLHGRGKPSLQPKSTIDVPVEEA
ncbi:TRAP transporter small permease subunit [Reyranella sp.]|uniref:TRAP transporter small permease subunit n=1 Tax=Reyranella sp. TaxID=1929291 RepID=UPI003BAC286D